MNENIQELFDYAEEIGCAVRLNENLSEYTTFKIGGACRAVFLPRNPDALASLVKTAKQLRVDYFVLGNGSNVLCDDKGYHGVIIKIGKDFDGLQLVGENEIAVSAGVSLARLCLFAMENSLTGLEFAYGIPGTVGGAVFMNAGAYGGEIKDVIVNCQTVDDEGNFKTYNTDEMELSYRHSIFQEKNNEIVTSAVFKLEKGEKENILAKMNELMAKRKEKQPLEFPNAGSTFKRPEGQFAGKLIQDCELRGYRVGGAMVSEKHCGFVVNYDNATFNDVMKVIKDVQQKVSGETGYFLECEVKILEY